MIGSALATGANVKPEFKRARTIILYSFSAVMYYVGLLIGYLKVENSVDSCDVYLSGNGAKLLKWISSDKATDEALRAMIHSAAPFLQDIGIRWSRANKHEVARGLLYDVQLSNNQPITLQIIGEEGFTPSLSDGVVPRTFNLYNEFDILASNHFNVPTSFPVLSSFLLAFDEQAKRLGLETSANLLSPQAIKAGIEQRIRKMSEKGRHDKALIQSIFVEEVKLVLEKLIDRQVGP